MGLGMQDKKENSAVGQCDNVSEDGGSVDCVSVASRRDVLVKALRAAPVVLLLTARGAQAQGSAASGAPSGG